MKTPFNDAVVAVVRGLGVGLEPHLRHPDPVTALPPS